MVFPAATTRTSYTKTLSISTTVSVSLKAPATVSPRCPPMLQPALSPSSSSVVTPKVPTSSATCLVEADQYSACKSVSKAITLLSAPTPPLVTKSAPLSSSATPATLPTSLTTTSMDLHGAQTTLATLIRSPT